MFLQSEFESAVVGVWHRSVVVVHPSLHRRPMPVHRTAGKQHKSRNPGGASALHQLYAGEQIGSPEAPSVVAFRRPDSVLERARRRSAPKRWHHPKRRRTATSSVKIAGDPVEIGQASEIAAGAHEHAYLGAFFAQPLDDEAPDDAGGAGNGHVHGSGRSTGMGWPSYTACHSEIKRPQQLRLGMIRLPRLLVLIMHHPDARPAPQRRQIEVEILQGVERIGKAVPVWKEAFEGRSDPCAARTRRVRPVVPASFDKWASFGVATNTPELRRCMSAKVSYRFGAALNSG